MLLLTWLTQHAESGSALGKLGGHTYYWVSLVAQMGKHLPAMQETGVRSLGWENPLEKEMEPTPVLLPGGYSPWGDKSWT